MMLFIVKEYGGKLTLERKLIKLLLIQQMKIMATKDLFQFFYKLYKIRLKELLHFQVLMTDSLHQ